MMVCIFGDTHGIYNIQKVFSYYDRFKEHITEEDYFIILGDFALPYYPINNFQNERELRTLEYLEELKCKVLIVDGNHEYFEYLDKCEEIEMFGNIVGKIWNNIYHLKRGNVYTIENRTFFTFGGARSIDKEYQESKGTWSSRELPSVEEKDRAIENLKKVDYTVDYILTHTAPNLLFKQVIVPIRRIDNFNDPTSEFLDILLEKVKFRKWCIGHYHIDFNFDNFSFLFNEVMTL